MTQRQTLGNGSVSDFDVFCPAGTVATGGGYEAGTSAPNIYVYRNIPEFDAADKPIGWDISYVNSSGITTTMTAYALCASP